MLYDVTFFISDERNPLELKEMKHVANKGELKTLLHSMEYNRKDYIIGFSVYPREVSYGLL